MDDAVELRELGRTAKRRWWIPALLILAGGVAGVLATGTVDRVHHAEGSLLVGPVEASVTSSSMLRASESQAAFYADLARRQVVLRPVAGRLVPEVPWQTLRRQVSASVPEQNPRVVTIRVADPSRARAQRITSELVKQLISLHPPRSGESEQAFVAEQVTTLRETVKAIETRIGRLQAAIAQQSDPATRAGLADRLADRERALDVTRQTYADLISLDTTGDAGVLQVLDDVLLTTAYDRAGLVRQGAAGAGIGAGLGLLVMLMLATPGRRRSRRRGASASTEDTYPDLGRDTVPSPAPARDQHSVRVPARGA